MRYIVYGAGAIGGAIGGLLHAAGLETLLIARGVQLETIKRQGLSVRTPSRRVQAHVPAFGHPREVEFRADDAVLLTMKAQDTEAALEDLQQAGGYDLPIMCCQNGVDNERMAARRFARVYGMLMAMPATYLQPGEVIAWGTPVAGVLDVGRFPAGRDAFIEQVAADLTEAGFSSRPDAAIMRLKYTKLLDNLGNAVQALTQIHRSDARARKLVEMLDAEAIACYRAAGIDFLPRDQYRELVGARCRMGDVEGEHRSGNSTWQSLVRGATRVETDYLNGEIVLLGALTGVPTPLNTHLRRLMQHAAGSGRPAGSYAIDELISALDRLSVGASSVS